ncbi:hypothetical protein CRE_07241 [Caenorhabditis remanei]|uniref:Uncharacterized protein n=1 Tax=Caenorhabditis remanei TaxID=31234 RepID=E3M237_CAERE|nr:hypothetical protein CRE_07241 [Caenorhabditis remanei]
MSETLNEETKKLNASIESFKVTSSEFRAKYHSDKFKSADTASKAEALRRLVQFYFELEDVLNTARSVARYAKTLEKSEKTEHLDAEFLHISLSLHESSPWMCRYIAFFQMELENYNRLPIAQPRISSVHVFLAKYAVLEITKIIKKNAKNLKRENRKMKIEMEKLKKRNAKLSSKIDQLKKKVEKNKKEEEELKNAKESINQLS